MKLADKSIVHLSIVPHPGVITSVGLGLLQALNLSGNIIILSSAFVSKLWPILPNVENNAHHKVNELQLLIEGLKKPLVIRFFCGRMENF